MRGGFGGNRGFSGGDRNGSHEEAPVCHEIAHALQLRICYKTDIPTEEETSEKFPGFHSRFTKPMDSKAHFLLFKDIESVEAAKAKLDKDDTVEVVDFMGLKSAKNQVFYKLKLITIFVFNLLLSASVYRESSDISSVFSN